MSSSRVYVGNLSWGVKWQDLKDHMGKAGKVQHADVFEDASGKSKGCGIVEYASPEGAQAAIESLNDSELFGRMIFVREDREEGKDRGERAPRTYQNYSRGDGSGNYGGGGSFNRRGGGRFSGGGRGGNSFRSGPPVASADDKGRQIFVSNLSWKTSWQDLKDLFKDCGGIVRADVIKFPDGRSKGVGTVLFHDAESADDAINRYNEYEFQDRKIQVRLDKYL
uniref:RRM domain-containing protein n=1 Tax=Chromera velia CCMP2878 TaxID=1169474 RepID=A0A0G4HA21_9ALVE|mmetsp:Transcript_21614/g.42991  ORF Transcript_21614/g.42991 Transcript_21614/m.42991 type:complete len:223 (-) Transcript_21614:1524-2192(-)|eukprot:Cvel_25411.t1-p1 / transcript=Cvel_25411.t1 / gene=Cvel_25411 / organism=Chromera_velia_CCMP2878 / gene_product=Myelin expression factor 2, putative / transcript_product=Myelin expression factor 2, putative / location=Cvel_scaffold2876:4508-7219(+) / protein_length=222 / sequence_SO=supercontig / SO=protein_coding / is_pseudo=false